MYDPEMGFDPEKEYFGKDGAANLEALRERMPHGYQIHRASVPNPENLSGQPDLPQTAYSFKIVYWLTNEVLCVAVHSDHRLALREVFEQFREHLCADTQLTPSIAAIS